MLYYIWYLLGYDMTEDVIIEDIKKVGVEIHQKELMYLDVINELKNKLIPKY
jgi:hypothetical protein